MRTLLAALLVPLSLLAAPLATEASADAAQTAAKAPAGLSLSSATATPGQALTASGTFKKAYAGRKVAVQVAQGSSWKTLATKAATAKGAYSIVLKAPSSPGNVRVRAYVAGKGKLRAAASAVKVLKVVKAGGPGSSDAPYGVGQSFSNGSWSFSFGRTDTNAWASTLQADEDNDAPAAGWSYVIVPVTFTNNSATADEPYWPNEIDLLGNDDEYYSDTTDDDQSCGTVPNDWADAPALAPGASLTANVCAVVPTAALTGALWSVENDDADDEALVRLG
jgi:hypothetical protein